MLTGGTPAPSGAGARSAEGGTTATQIKIDPSAAEGYENIPEAMKRLFGGSPREITLADVVRETMGSNRSIKIQNYTLQMAGDQVPLSKGIYDLVLSANAQWARDASQTSSGLAPAGVRRTRDYSAALSQLLPTGAQAELGYDYRRVAQFFQFSTLNPTIDQSLALRVSQPLLQGFGPKATNAAIRIAQTDYKISAAQFEAEIQNQVRDAVNTYWDLVFAVRSYDVQLISYMAALDLLRVNHAKVEAGVLAPTEELQARAAAETRRDLIIRARLLVRNAEDRLKRTMFFENGGPNWALELLPVQELTWREVQADYDHLLAEAVERRPEARASRAMLERSKDELIPNQGSAQAPARHRRARRDQRRRRIGRDLARESRLPRLRPPLAGP